MKLPWSKSKPISPDEFWNWVIANREKFEGEPTRKFVNEVGAKLAAVDPDLCFECGRAKDGVFEFVLSADGIKSVFPKVAALARSAPDIPGWRVVQFRQREPGVKIQFGDAEVSEETIFYRILDEYADGVIEVAIFIDGLTPKNERHLVGAAFIVLDKALGEQDVATRLGHIEFHNKSLSNDSDQPVSTLASVVDSRKPI